MTDRESGHDGSLADLLSDLIRDLGRLVRSEARLMRAELVDAGRSVAGGVEMMAAGGVLVAVALLVLVQAAVIALAYYVGPLWASVIVAGLLGLIGTVLILRGKGVIKAANLVPDRTIEQTSRDFRLAKDQL